MSAPATRRASPQAHAAEPGSAGAPVAITRALLRDWPLPRAEASGRGKESRGRVFVAGGSTQVPGAAMLAGIGALRAGAGKLHMAIGREAALALAMAVPEARVQPLAQAHSGEIAAGAAEDLVAAIDAADAALLGPGVLDVTAAQDLLGVVLPRVRSTPLVLDAGALAALSARRDAVRHLDGRVVLTPHLLELALMLGVAEGAVTRAPLRLARQAAAETEAVVVLKGARTYVATPRGAAYRYDEGSIGLATSGSGDTLAGVVAGLLARGAAPAQAAVWAVYLHGDAGRRMAARLGPLGFLAREVLAEVPAVLAEVES